MRRKRRRRRENDRANDISGARLNLFTCISAKDTLWSPSALDEVEECTFFSFTLFLLAKEGEETGTGTGSEIDIISTTSADRVGGQIAGCTE